MAMTTMHSQADIPRQLAGATLFSDTYAKGKPWLQVLSHYGYFGGGDEILKIVTGYGMWRLGRLWNIGGEGIGEGCSGQRR